MRSRARKARYAKFLTPPDAEAIRAYVADEARKLATAQMAKP